MIWTARLIQHDNQNRLQCQFERRPIDPVHKEFEDARWSQSKKAMAPA
jgi:hypothetical protein